MTLIMESLRKAVKAMDERQPGFRESWIRGIEKRVGAEVAGRLRKATK